MVLIAHKCNESKMCDTMNTQKNLFDALTFCSSYISRECNLIYTAGNFVMLLVLQRSTHTLKYLCKYQLESCKPVTLVLYVPCYSPNV
jgi:hypothetical protein